MSIKKLVKNLTKSDEILLPNEPGICIVDCIGKVQDNSADYIVKFSHPSTSVILSGENLVSIPITATS